MAIEDTKGGVNRAEAFRQKSKLYSDLGSSIGQSAKAKRGENWAAFAHSGLIALDVASLGTLGSARTSGELLKVMKHGPVDRPLQGREKIEVELTVLAMQQAQADAAAAQQAGNLKASRESLDESTRHYETLEAQRRRSNAQQHTTYITKQMEGLNKRAELVQKQRQLEQQVIDGELTDAQQSTANEYTARLSGVPLESTEYQTKLQEVADDLAAMDPIAAENVLNGMGDVGLNFRRALESSDYQHLESVRVLDTKLKEAPEARAAMGDQQLIYAKQEESLQKEIKALKPGYAAAIKPGETGQAGGETVEGSAAAYGIPELDTTYLRSLVDAMPDVRPESQRLIEEARKSEAYNLAMTELGLNPDDALDREIFEKQSRKSMRKLKRLKMRALRKGVPLESLPQFQKFLEEEKGQFGGSPKLSDMRKQLMLLYAGVDIDEIRGLAVGGEDLEALPEAGEDDSLDPVSSDESLVSASNLRLQNLRQLVGEDQEQMLTSGRGAASDTAIETTEGIAEGLERDRGGEAPTLSGSQLGRMQAAGSPSGGEGLPTKAIQPREGEEALPRLNPETFQNPETVKQKRAAAKAEALKRSMQTRGEVLPLQGY